MCQKSGEISLLKQQLKEIQSELSQKAGDIVVLKAQLREARSELQASQVRSQEAQVALRTRSLELEVCENELQRRKSEAELLQEKVGRLEEESARRHDTLTNHSGYSLPGNATKKGQSMSLTLQQGRGVTGRGGPDPACTAMERRLIWSGEKRVMKPRLRGRTQKQCWDSDNRYMFCSTPFPGICNENEIVQYTVVLLLK